MPEKKRNIYLIGMPGSGKSTIGRSLAKYLHLTFVDADHAIVTRTGVAIGTIFELEGETGFRQREATLISELSEGSGLLVATGGGAILSPINRELLRRTGVVIYLKAKIDDLWTRTKNDSKRPLLRTNDPRSVLTSLLKIREPLYAEIADLTIETAGYPKVARLVNDIVVRLVQDDLWERPATKS